MNLTGKFAAFICCLAFFAACKKAENNSANNNSNNNNNNNNNSNLSAKGQMLVAGRWQLIADVATATYMGKDTTFDYYAEIEECDKDNFVTFAEDGTVTLDRAVNKCDGDNQTYTFPWALLDNDTRLALVDSNPDTFDIVNITNMELKFKITWENSSGIPITKVSTYKNIK